MMISLHKNSRTTPVIRQRMSGSLEPAAVLALRYGVSEETTRKWKRHDSVQDLSATAHNLQTTLPKGTELSDASQTGFNDVVRPMNICHRKNLGRKTPAETMIEEITAFNSTIAPDI